MTAFRWKCGLEKVWARQVLGVEIGHRSYGVPKIHGRSGNYRVRIGRYSSISSDVHFFLHADHRTDWVSTFPFAEMLPGTAKVPGHPASRGDILVGNDVWIGFGATVLSGVTLGDGAVVAARAVVSKDVPPYSVVAGNPAREIRRRFSDSTIADLLEVRWWDLDDELIERVVPLLTSGRTADLVATVRGFRSGCRASELG